MKRKKLNNKWELCSFCQQIKLVRGSNHECPEAVRIKREIEIEREVSEELLFWELSETEFWTDSRTQFYKYLAENGEI